MKSLLDYIPRLAGKLAEHLAIQNLEKGDLWTRLPREGQEERIFTKFGEYWNKFLKGEPIPWLKIIGLALIAMIREGSLDMPGDDNQWK